MGRPVDYDITVPHHFDACASYDGGPCTCAEIEADLYDREMEARCDRARDKE